MNTAIVNQANGNVNVAQPIMITSTAWAWGFEDACKGESVYAGYHLFTGAKLSDYKRGWAAGRKARSN